MVTKENTVIRVGLVDDHDVVRVGLQHQLAGCADIEFVAAAPTTAQLLALNIPLDLVLLDLSLDDRSLPEVNAQALAERGIPCLAYTSGENAYLLQSAAKGGVRGVARKSLSPDGLCEMIRLAVANDPAVLGQEWAAAIDGDPALGAIQLSQRQRDVLELFASGESAKRVARRTGLSETTVNDYLLRIRAKYASQGRDASTKIALYQRALEDGVLPPPQR